MEPKIGQIWKYTNSKEAVTEYHLIVGHNHNMKRWFLYNIETGNPDMDYVDQFEMPDIWTFIQ